MQLTQSLRQELNISQKIVFSNLMAVPDEVMRTVAEAIKYNPDNIEAVLQETKSKAENSDGKDFADKRVQSIYSSLIPSKGESNGKGLVGSPDLRGLEGCIKDYDLDTTSDATIIGRKEDKPEIFFSEHIKGAKTWIYLLDPSLYPETSKLLNQLKNFEEWKTRTLRDAYVLIAGKQREYFEEFNPLRFNVFNHKNLAGNMNLSESTIGRILSNRRIEARNIEGEQRCINTKDLLKSRRDLQKYNLIPKINEILKSEFENGEACSDDNIREEMEIDVSRESIKEYRLKSGIPGSYERNRFYKKGLVDKPYQIICD